MSHDKFYGLCENKCLVEINTDSVGAAKTDLTNVDNTVFAEKATEAGVGGSGGGVGKDLAGQEVNVSHDYETGEDVTVTAGTNAEIFNDYRDRTYVDAIDPELTISPIGVSSGNIASGKYSHAEGVNTTARGMYSHAEGRGTYAKTNSCHAEGEGTTAAGFASHAEGHKTTASGDYSHAEGKETTASGNFSHAEGENTTASGEDGHAEGYFTTASGGASHAEGDSTTASGVCSHAEGCSAVARGEGSHAEGYETKAYGAYSHAEGYQTETFNITTNGDYAHAEGYKTEASGICSHAEGERARATGVDSHAEGASTLASGNCSHAGGHCTIASNYQLVHGRYNKESAGPTSDQDTTGDLFIIGQGNSSTRANAFRVTTAGKAYGLQSYSSSGADYSEYFEWLDGNPENENRKGYFVTLDGKKIKKVSDINEYVLGVVSATPSVEGDSQSEMWQGMYLTDVFGEKLTEVVEVEETTDEHGKVIPAHTETRWILNPDYDSTKIYENRESRKEWSPVGLIGKLVAIDDGTCQVNSYCKPNKDGIATASDTGHRVMERLDENHIRILLK